MGRLCEIGAVLLYLSQCGTVLPSAAPSVVQCRTGSFIHQYSLSALAKCPTQLVALPPPPSRLLLSRETISQHDVLPN